MGKVYSASLWVASCVMRHAVQPLCPREAALLGRALLAPPHHPHPAGTHLCCPLVAPRYPHSLHGSPCSRRHHVVPSTCEPPHRPTASQPLSSFSSWRGRGEEPRGKQPQCSRLSPSWLAPLWTRALVTSLNTHRFNEHCLVACWSSSPPSHLDSHFINQEMFFLGGLYFFLL